MIITDTLNSKTDKKTFNLYAARSYVNPRCVSVAEFDEDVKRFTTVRRLLRKYRSSGELEVRLILNTVLIISNVFSIGGAVALLYAKVDVDLHPALKPFLLYLSMEAEDATVDISLDLYVVNALRNL